MVASHSQFLSGVWAYRAPGVAWVTLVVVTNPKGANKKFCVNYRNFSVEMPLVLVKKKNGRTSFFWSTSVD